MIGIYKITSPSGKVYVGQSRNIEKRFETYKRKLGSGQIRLYRSMKKYGIKNHMFEIIEECLFEELNIKERYYQDLYDVLNENGLNCILTSTNILPKEVSELTKIKMKENNSKYWLGKKRSEESCLKMSIARTGMKRRPKTLKEKEEISIRNSGELNGMFNKKGILNPNSKKVINIETKIVYNSLNECCIENNLNPKYMSRWLSNTRPNKTIYKYL